MQLENKDVWLNPGDLFKLNIITGGADTYKKYVNYINADGDQTPNVSGTETPYQKAFALGLKKPINFDLIVRNAMGGADDVTKTLLNENDNLNNVFNFGETLDVNDQGDKIKTDEELLDQYREAVQTEGYSIYSGKYSGTLNFSISLNQTKGFSVAPSYLINIKRDEESETPKSTISYSVILRVILPKYYREDYITDTIGATQNEYLKVVNLKKDNLLVEGVDMANVSGFIKLKNSKNEFEISETDKQTLIDLYSIGKDEDADARLQQIFSGEDLYGIFVIKDIPIKDEDKEYPEGDETGKFSFTFVPQTQLGFECKNTQTWEIDFNNLNNSPFTLNTWNYYTNYDNENPLELNFGYEGSYDENIVNKVSHCVISFFDIYHNRELKYYVKIMNNGTNFKSYTIDIPYRTAGSMGALDTNTLEPEVFDQIYEDENSYYKRILIDGTGLAEQEDTDTGIMKLSGGGKAKILDPISQYYKDSKNELTLSDDLSEVREANKDIVFIEGRDIKPETSPLIKSSLYLCCIQLVDNNDELITQDYRFLYTTPTFDEQNIHDDFVELFPETYQLLEISPSASNLMDLTVYSPDLQYASTNDLSGDTQPVGIKASYKQVYTTAFFNQFFPTKQLTDYFVKNANKLFKTDNKDITLFWDENEYAEEINKVSLEDMYDKKQYMSKLYLYIDVQEDNVTVQSTYIALIEQELSYILQEIEFKQLLPIKASDIIAPSVEKEDDSIQLYVNYLNGLASGENEWGEGVTLNRFNSGDYDHDYMFIPSTRLDSVFIKVDESDKEMWGLGGTWYQVGYNHKNQFLLNSFMPGNYLKFDRGNLTWRVTMTVDEKDSKERAIYLKQNGTNIGKFDFQYVHPYDNVDISDGYTNLKQYAPIVAKSIPIYLLTKTLGIINLPEYTTEADVANFVQDSTFSSLLVADEASTTEQIYVLGPVTVGNLSDTINLEIGIDEYLFTYKSTINEVLKNFESVDKEEINLNNITYEQTGNQELIIETTVLEDLQNQFVVGDSIIGYVMTDTNEILTKTVSGSRLQDNVLYVLYQEELYRHEELEEKVREMYEEKWGKTQNRIGQSDIVSLLVEKLKNNVGNTQALNEFKLDENLYLWVPLVMQYANGTITFTSKLTEGLMTINIKIEGECHANNGDWYVCPGIGQGIMRIFPLPFFVQSTKIVSN